MTKEITEDDLTVVLRTVAYIANPISTRWVMQPKYCFFLHIALLPVYISLAVYLDFLPQTTSSNLSSLLRLAKANLRAQYLKNIQTFSTESTPMNSMKFVARRSEERGHADHDWLKTFHTFSFAMFVSFLGICILDTDNAL